MKEVEFFNHLKRDVMVSINTSMPCKVLNYDKGRKRAKIQPLFQSKEVGKEPVNLPVLEDVPVSFQRFEFTYSDAGHGERTMTTEFTPVLQSGDIVMVVFSQRAIDDIFTGQPVYPSIRKWFRLRDAVVIGVIE